MTRPATDPALDLTIQRTIGAPRERARRPQKTSPNE